MNIMSTVRLNEIRKAAGATDAGDSGDFLMPHLALLDQLKVKRKHRKIAAAGAPRRVIGADFFLGQSFACFSRDRLDRSNVTAASGNLYDGGTGGTHVYRCLIDLKFSHPGSHVAFGAVEDFFDLPRQAVGFVDAADLRVTIASA